MRALNSFVLIKVEKPKKANTFQATPENRILTGVIVSTGSDVKDMQKGDMVAFHKDKALEYVTNGESYFMLDYKTVMFAL